MSKIVWNQREVIEAIAVEVASNMETAAKVVEVDARRRLLGIKEPERGRPYRRVLALYRLTSMVVRDGLEIDGLIGIPPGAKGGDYGFWIEKGSRTAPAQPWLLPALLTNLKAIMGMLAGK